MDPLPTTLPPLSAPPSPPAPSASHGSASPAHPSRRRYAFEYPSEAALDPRLVAAAAAQRPRSDRCLNRHYVAFVQRQQDAQMRAPQRTSSAGSGSRSSSPTPSAALHPSQSPLHSRSRPYSELDSPSPPPVSLPSAALSYPQPLPSLYTSTASTALPRAELSTAPLRLYDAFIWLACGAAGLYMLLEYEQRKPPGRGAVGEEHVHALTPLRTKWKALKASWQPKPATSPVERRDGDTGALLLPVTTSTTAAS